MPESVLSFASSSSFRDLLIARNLAPYQVQGVFTPPPGNAIYEISPLNDSNVIDSPDNLISTKTTKPFNGVILISQKVQTKYSKTLCE
jgi:hypothetical protein